MATSSTQGHLRKRQFQPSINSYFHSREVNANTGLPVSRTTSPLSPPLPAETKASLLSVGMRVRKSIPEGYKTHKTLGSPGFPFPPPTSTAPPRSGYGSASAKELTPFCGLHKTGGWAVQEAPISSAPAVMKGYDVDEYEVPGLTMSQNTMASSQNSFLSSASIQYAGSGRKRTYEEEVEDDLDEYFDEVAVTGPVGQRLSLSRSGKPMARMKQVAEKPALGGVVRVAGQDDFDEASFLAPVEGMDLDEM